MADGVSVTLLYSPAPRKVHEWKARLAPGATVMEALQACGLPELVAAVETRTCAVGVWGRQCHLDTLLKDGDRIELYRPLLVDPKVARRERFRKQGVKTAGLFAQRRAGGKAGY